MLRKMGVEEDVTPVPSVQAAVVKLRAVRKRGAELWGEVGTCDSGCPLDNFGLATRELRVTQFTVTEFREIFLVSSVQLIFIPSTLSPNRKVR